jgi:hypothetical protein
MKAEHRKELETNTLADGVGHLVTRMKDRPRRSTLGYAVVAGLFVIVLILVWRWFYMSRMENTERWYLFDTGTQTYLANLIKSAPETNPGKAALLEQSWITFWEQGMKGLGHKPADAMKQLEEAYREYTEAAERCQGDPTFEPEALYAKAIIQETKALLDRKHLDTAREQYEQLAQKYDQSAFGKLAGERVAVLKDERKRAELVQFYQNLAGQLGLDRPEPKAPDFGLPGLGGLKGFDKKIVPPGPPDK